MNRALVASAVLVCALPLAAQRRRAIAASPLPYSTCTEGGAAFATLTPVEVDAMVKAAAAALNVNTATIAIVDRSGRPLAVFRQPAAGSANDDQAVGVARTAAFFSHDMAPLSSRTVRFISGIHFPPGVANAPNAPLYGIENTNRCDLGVTFNAGKTPPQTKSLAGGPGPGIVTGKVQPADADPAAVNAGGIPIYRASNLVGGIGVTGVSGDPQLAEFMAVTGVFGGGFAPLPAYPLPEPGNVFIDGIRLPFLGPEQKLRVDDSGNPVGLVQPHGTAPGTPAGTYSLTPSVVSRCADNGYLAGPMSGNTPLTPTQIDAIVQRAISAAKKTRAAIRLPLNSYARMVIAVSDLDGKIVALDRMPDATVFSVDVSVAKARNVVAFSSGGLPGVPPATAVTNRTIGFGAQPLYPPGIDRSKPGPFYSLFLSDLANPCQQGNGIVFFAGSTPLYVNGKLAGGLGVSGDGVEQDDYVTVLAAGEFLPDKKIWADQVVIDKVRLPMFKFPRQPEGVTECGGKPCS
jgi:uncharacterized protein GlcG (DUF336 family)